MKTRYYSILLLAALFLPRFVAAQTPAADVILIGDTTDMVLGAELPYQHFTGCYTQQLVLGSELNGAAMITGLDLYCGNSSNVGRQCTIYLANTYVPLLISMVPFGVQFQQVAVATLGTVDGWCHYDFSTPFFYNGLGNLVLAFDTPYGMGGGDFYCEYTQNISRYVGCNLDYLTPSFPTNGNTHRNIMRLHTQPVPAPVAACPAPVWWVDSVGSTAVSVNLSSDNNDYAWEVECVTDGDTAWRTSGLIMGGTSYTMAGLTPNTHYTFRLTAFCTDTSTSVLRHIRTNCTPMEMPFSEGFEDMWYLPACWDTTAGSGGSGPSTTSHYSHGGSRCMKLFGGSVILPLLDAPTDSLELSFWTKNGTTNPSQDLYVGVVIDPLDPSTFIPVDTIGVSHYTDWSPVVVRFDNYTGAPGRLAIKTAIDYNEFMYIDDIEVNLVAPCQTITAVIVDQVTDTTAVVHWANSGAAYYEVAYGPSGFTIDASNIVTDIHADSLQLSGLLPYTLYDVYVRSYCGNAYTNWSPVHFFHTYCSLLDTLSYMENFDSYVGHPMPSELPCWRGHTDANTCIVGGGRSGSLALRWWWSSYDDSPQYAILPALNTTVIPLSTLQLSFWAKNMEDVYNLHGEVRVVVGVMDDPGVGSTFLPIDTVSILGDDWHRYDVSLAGYSGTGNYIAIKSCQGIGTETDAVALIDDLMLDLITPCLNVTGMTLASLTATSATVRWDNQEGTVWQVCIDTVETAIPVADTAYLTTPEYTFNDLATGTPYYVWVRSICANGETSEWEGPLQLVPGIWNMRPNKNDTLTMCGVTLYDDGGPNGDFGTQISSLVIMPDSPSHLVTLSGYCNIGGSSTLTIYDGVGTSGSVLWTKVYNSNFAFDFGPIVSNEGPMTLVFHGDTYFYTYEGFELQVSCVPDTCIIHHLRLDPSVEATDTTIALTWECNGASLYEVEYGPVGFTLGTGTHATTATNSFVITGLFSLDRREVYVRSLCGVGDTGARVRGIFTSQPCSDVVFRENFDSTMLYNAHPTAPIGFNGNKYSYVQTLIEPSRLVGLENGITALAFHPIEYVEGDHQDKITVYLANVPETNLNAGPILRDAEHHFVKVIDSANFCHMPTTEWQLIAFDHSFLWDGHSSLLVAVLREDGGYGAIAPHYSSHYSYSDFIDTVYRSYQIVGFNHISIDSIQYYSLPEYNCYASFLTGDLRLYSNCLFAFDFTSDPTDNGISDIQLPTSDIQIYPNPATSRVTIQSPNALVAASLTDMMGRREEVRLNLEGGGRYSLDLTARPQGAYFLILTTAEGRRHILKLIKQ